jgi:hypothetical protein
MSSFEIKDGNYEEEEMDFLDDINHQLQMKLKRTKSEISKNAFEFKKILNGFIKENQKLEENISEKENENTTLKITISQKTGIISKNEVLINELNEILVEKDIKIKNLTEDLKRLQKRYDDLFSNELKTLKNYNFELQEKIKSLQTEMKNLESENVNLKQKKRFSKSLISVGTEIQTNKTSVDLRQKEKKFQKKKIIKKASSKKKFSRTSKKDYLKPNKENNLKEGGIFLTINNTPFNLEPLKLTADLDEDAYSIESNNLSKSVFTINTHTKLDLFEKPAQLIPQGNDNAMKKKKLVSQDIISDILTIQSKNIYNEVTEADLIKDSDFGSMADKNKEDNFEKLIEEKCVCKNMNNIKKNKLNKDDEIGKIIQRDSKTKSVLGIFKEKLNFLILLVLLFIVHLIFQKKNC